LLIDRFLFSAGLPLNTSTQSINSNDTDELLRAKPVNTALEIRLAEIDAATKELEELYSPRQSQAVAGDDCLTVDHPEHLIGQPFHRTTNHPAKDVDVVMPEKVDSKTPHSIPSPRPADHASSASHSPRSQPMLDESLTDSFPKPKFTEKLVSMPSYEDTVGNDKQKESPTTSASQRPSASPTETSTAQSLRVAGNHSPRMEADAGPLLHTPPPPDTPVESTQPIPMLIITPSEVQQNDSTPEAVVVSSLEGNCPTSHLDETSPVTESSTVMEDSVLDVSMESAAG